MVLEYPLCADVRFWNHVFRLHDHLICLHLPYVWLWVFPFCSPPFVVYLLYTCGVLLEQETIFGFWKFYHRLLALKVFIDVVGADFHHLLSGFERLLSAAFFTLVLPETGFCFIWPLVIVCGFTPKIIIWDLLIFEPKVGEELLEGKDRIVSYFGDGSRVVERIYVLETFHFFLFLNLLVHSVSTDLPIALVFRVYVCFGLRVRDSLQRFGLSLFLRITCLIFNAFFSVVGLQTYLEHAGLVLVLLYFPTIQKHQILFLHPFINQ